MSNATTPPGFLHRHWRACLAPGVLLLALLWAALAPLRGASQEALFEVPPQAHARRAHGERLLLVPSELRLTLGVRAVLLLRNRDSVPLVFGPLQVRPGQEFRLPFEQAGSFRYACPLLPGGELVVTVVPQPDPGWERLRWRLQAAVHALRYLPLQAPAR